jgi:hypothetical protein
MVAQALEMRLARKRRASEGGDHVGNDGLAAMREGSQPSRLIDRDAVVVVR